MHILVTGGAGYIGSVVVEALIRRRHGVVALDNLRQGHRGAVVSGAEFIQADLLDAQALTDIFQRYKFEAVMHLAAETIVSNSVSDPRKFFHNNVIGTINLLDGMLTGNVAQIIFSSSAAVYGEHGAGPIKEAARKAPVNAYGDSKLICEGILSRYGKAYGIKHISLRYFNAAGATTGLGEDHHPETHLIPVVLESALSGNPVTIFGADYATQDGTCVRDYVHVEDISRAHVLALEKLDAHCGEAFNLGNEQGYSVLEVVNKAREITQVDIPVIFSGRRTGDPAVLVACSDLARQNLGWKPELSDLGTIIRSAWDWKREHRDGFST